MVLFSFWVIYPALIQSVRSKPFFLTKTLGFCGIKCSAWTYKKSSFSISTTNAAKSLVAAKSIPKNAFDPFKDSRSKSVKLNWITFPISAF